MRKKALYLIMLLGLPIISSCGRLNSYRDLTPPNFDYSLFHYSQRATHTVFMNDYKLTMGREKEKFDPHRFIVEYEQSIIDKHNFNYSDLTHQYETIGSGEKFLLEVDTALGVIDKRGTSSIMKKCEGKIENTIGSDVNEIYTTYQRDKGFSTVFDNNHMTYYDTDEDFFTFDKNDDFYPILPEENKPYYDFYIDGSVYTVIIDNNNNLKGIIQVSYSAKKISYRMKISRYQKTIATSYVEDLIREEYKIIDIYNKTAPVEMRDKKKYKEISKRML